MDSSSQGTTTTESSDSDLPSPGFYPQPTETVVTLSSIVEKEPFTFNGQVIIETERVVCVGQVVTISISAPAISQDDINITLRNSNGALIPVVLTRVRRGLFTFQYAPKRPGKKFLEVEVGRHKIKGSPFTIYVYGPQFVKVTPKKGGAAGKPVEFNVDVSKAGPGDLEVKILDLARRVVRHGVKQTGNGVYLVGFIPRDTGSYTILITLNGKMVAGCPAVVNIRENYHSGEGDRHVTWADISDKTEQKNDSGFLSPSLRNISQSYDQRDKRYFVKT